MSTAAPASNVPIESERGLVRQLSAGQQAMMAIGGAIGTGLFLGSGLTVAAAGPAVVLSYVIAAFVAMLLCAALTEMAVMHPTAGSFGLYAATYVSPFAGYAVRVSYWLCYLIATAGHMVAIAVYMQLWFPGVPTTLWIAACSLALIWLNTREVGTVGSFEYWFSMIKVVTIIVFAVLALALIFGLTGEGPGLSHYTAHGGFVPNGLWGIWSGAVFAIYSFISVETVAVTSGEAKDPARTIPSAMTRLVVSLTLLYGVTVLLLVGVSPWKELGVGESPFVTVLRQSGVPAAAHVMNFVVLTAALSGANANLYLVTRMFFSLARAGFLPATFGEVSSRGVPLPALLCSSLVLGLAIVAQMLLPGSAYAWLFGIALFGGLLVWFMIFVTHLAFRRVNRAEDLIVRMPCATTMSTIGAVLVAAALISTWFIGGLRITILAGGPWMLLLCIGYWLSRPSNRSDS